MISLSNSKLCLRNSGPGFVEEESGFFLNLRQGAGLVGIRDPRTVRVSKHGLCCPYMGG